ncbi:hypothetical protein [Mesorhizobium sp. M0139]|uniref:hypothetical protein n=1 Tax=Mesorhizobium sp. M0139 TaxID=2956892 RepID=UPI0033356C2F
MQPSLDVARACLMGRAGRARAALLANSVVVLAGRRIALLIWHAITTVGKPKASIVAGQNAAAPGTTGWVRRTWMGAVDQPMRKKDLSTSTW